MFYKPLFTLLLVLTSCSFIASAQITTQQARSVDSALVAQQLEFGNFHTTNYHDLPGGGVFTWDAGNGLYVGIADYAVAWSHSGSVADTLAAMLDTMPGQAYRLFNLDLMPDVQHYHDLVTNWLGSLGIPVGLLQLGAEKLEVRANRMGIQITFPENGAFELLIFTSEGKQLYTETGEAVGGTTQSIHLPEKAQGVLLVKLLYRSSSYYGKVMW
jgi:hypothetical protein